MYEDDPRDQYRPSSLDDDDRSRSEYYSHCATTASLTDDSAILPNTLDASILADTIPESVNKDSKTDIARPDFDNELLMDIDTYSDEGQAALQAVYQRQQPWLLKSKIINEIPKKHAFLY
jgi:hypothetical protein